jgi:carbonic anhydrase
MGGPDKFIGVQFHFHAGSEHTVDGKRHDLEMHTVHLPVEARGDFKYAAMGIIFSVNDYNARLTEDQEKVIDDFFDSLSWDDAKTTPSPVVP